MTELHRPVADSTDNWVDGLAPLRLRPYLRLARLDRPIGSWLLLLPCWWSVALAAIADKHGLPNPWHLFLFFVGAFAMRGSGCTWNDIVDREIDGQVERTRSRPHNKGQDSGRTQGGASHCVAAGIGIESGADSGGDWALDGRHLYDAYPVWPDIEGRKESDA